MSSGTKKHLFRRLILLVLAVSTLVCGSCIKAKIQETVSYVQEKDIPVTVAVLPAHFTTDREEKGALQLDPESENGQFLTDLVRGVVHNQFAGKGYETHVLSVVDTKLASTAKPWHEMASADLCRLLGVQGIIYTHILSASMITAVAFNLYAIEAQIQMVNARGNELGAWTDSSSRRKIAIPTGPVSAAAAAVEAIFDESERKNMRAAVYDWGWKIAQFIPDNPKATALPEVLAVTTNVDKKRFAAGEQIHVEITAENGLTCSFDIGDFRKTIPIPFVEDVTYRGSYLVREGDLATAQPIVIQMIKPNGISRIWIETGGAVEIDGVPPPGPEQVNGVAGRQGVTLTWDLPKSEEVKSFIIEKSDTAVGTYALHASSQELSYVDADVPQGQTVYYRVRAVDAAGNLSTAQKPIRITMPHFDEVVLNGVLQGILIPGVYRITGQALVPAGEIVTVEPGVRINMDTGSGILVQGSMIGAGTAGERIIFTGATWQGLLVEPGGRLNLSHTILSGCSSCIEAKGSIVNLHALSATGKHGNGILLGENSFFEMVDIHLKGFEKGVTVAGGRGTLTKSTLTGNRTGLHLNQGNLTFEENNVFGNATMEIISDQRMVLDGNYLGSPNVKDLLLAGKVTVKSLLDAPFPHGRRIVLIDDQDMSPKALAEQYAAFKEQGIKAFQSRKYGQAHEALSKALSLKDDKDVYLYLAYTQMSLGEDEALSATLERGIKAYPYEVRLYQVYIKHLAAAGKKKESLVLLDKALKMNPDDHGLRSLKESLEESPMASLTAAVPVATPGSQRELMEKEALGQEVSFEQAKKQGIESFEKRQFKDAEENLIQALSIKADKDVFLYLAYTQMNLGEDEKLVGTLKRAIATFPQEIRAYQMYIRYLTNAGEGTAALKILEDALRIAPDDPTLRMQKDFLERVN